MDLSQAEMLPTKEELDKGPIVLMCSLDDLKMYYPVLQPWLNKGAQTDPLFDAVRATESIFSGESQVWVAVHKGKIKGVFCTALLEDLKFPGEKCCDVFALAGEDFYSWREEMMRMINVWANYNECSRIIFGARSMAALRLYKHLGKIEHIGKDPATGHEMFEVML